MSSYRFCRTDDMALLVDALNRCWAPHFPDEPPITIAGFKRSIRDLQVWCSSCMVAFAGAEPIGVLIGAKRPSATLVHRIAVHPDHRRQGHGAHLLTSLSSKLAILGPPRIVAEVPETLDAARALFSATGYVEEAVLTDYVRQGGESGRERIPGRLIIPVTIDDLQANGLLSQGPETCWERSVETLAARKEEIQGLAVASDERLEACILYIRRAEAPEIEILSLRSFADDGGARLRGLLGCLDAQGTGGMRLVKVHPAELSREFLEALGFRSAGTHRLYAARARAG